MSNLRLIRGIRWGGLFAWIAACVIFDSISSGRPAIGHRSVMPTARRARAGWYLDEPPNVARPSIDVIAQLADTSDQIAPTMMYVGHPEGDSGTAFVISRTHRLLATNAHVAEIMQECGSMIAVCNGSHVTYRVDRIWFHPDYARVKEEGAYVRASGRWIAYAGAPAPDVAVLQLAVDGPDLPGECRIADRGESRRLASQPVGMLGFSGQPTAPDQPMTALFKVGAVSLLTEFTARWDRARLWTMVDFTAAGAEGDSGGPVFLPDGRVIAIFAWSRARRDKAATDLWDSSAGIGIDCLWELLDHYALTK